MEAVASEKPMNVRFKDQQLACHQAIDSLFKELSIPDDYAVVISNIRLREIQSQSLQRRVIARADLKIKIGGASHDF